MIILFVSALSCTDSKYEFETPWFGDLVHGYNYGVWLWLWRETVYHEGCILHCNRSSFDSSLLESLYLYHPPTPTYMYSYLFTPSLYRIDVALF